MLFFVVLFHSVSSYTVTPSAVWAFKDQVTTITADLVVRFVHLFTLPTFFMLAGFFSAILYLRRGPEEFARNRAFRIALPFVVGWLVLQPVVGAGFVFALAARTGTFADGWAAVQAAIMNGSLFFRDSTIHLWFMYDLVIFYVMMLVLAPTVIRLPADWRDGALELFGSIIARPWLRLPVLAFITTGMLLMVGGTLYASLSFVPNWRLLLGYGMYFGIGWLLYLKREEVFKFERFAWTHTLLGLSLFFYSGPVVRLLPAGTLSRATLYLLFTTLGATIVWLLFFGFCGLFLRHLNRPAPAVRYIVDASFWIYLIHMPFAIWLPGLFSGLTLPPWIKILMVLSITYVAGFAMYDLFVRSTIIGSVLSGRRYPRVFFATNGSVPA